MKQYLDVLDNVLYGGVPQQNRTGVDTRMIPGSMMQFDLQQGFPILTTKKMAFKSIVGELLGFIRGYDNAKDFRDLGCKIWDANANDNGTWLNNPNRRGLDDLGRIYGVQWRQWRTPARLQSVPVHPYVEIDQLRNAINAIQTDPTSRRIIVSAWNPGELDLMALPPCHLLYQFIVGQRDHALHMTMYMRSCDMFLGVPFNITSYALLLSIIAEATRYKPGMLTMFLADCHIYENHLEQVEQQLQREPRTLPELRFINRVSPSGPTTILLNWIEALQPPDFELAGYDPHPPITATMAV